MKLTYITQYYPPHTGGLELVAKRQAESAAALGHDVQVVTYKLPKMKTGVATERGVEVHRVRGWQWFDRKFGIPFVFGGFGMVRAVFRAVKQADIVHVHDVFYLTSLVAFWATCVYHKQLVVSQHVAMVSHTSKFVEWAEQTVYKLWGFRIFRASERIITYQPVVRNFLVSVDIPEDKILQVHNGIDIDVFVQPQDVDELGLRRMRLGLPVDRPLVLFVGRMVPKKGYKELFEARDPAYDLVFVGPGALPAEWNNTPGVHVMGSMSQEQLAELYPIVDVLAAPSQGEMFTLVMQEAFAAGLPVVTTDAYEYESYELDRELICLCEPEPEVLRGELTRITADPVLRKRMGQYSRSLAETYFNWDTNVTPVFDLYTELHENRVFVTTSWDDGHIADLRLAELLKQYGMKGTFYISPRDHEFPEAERLTPDLMKVISRDFEIGAHTLTHRHLTTLDTTEAQFEIVDSRKYFENLLVAPITSFCYPAGKYTSEHVALVRDAGFQYARTVRRFVYERPSTPLEAGTSVHTYDHWSDVWPVMKLANYNPFRFLRLYRHWDRQAIAMFDRVYNRGGVFHLWGHSWELNGRNGWERLEAVLEHISRREGVRYVDNRDLV